MVAAWPQLELAREERHRYMAAKGSPFNAVRRCGWRSSLHRHRVQARDGGGGKHGAGPTARNIVLVYMDVRGLGRRVIAKRIAKTWVKGRVAEDAAAQRR
jgi:hypothetical protein